MPPFAAFADAPADARRLDLSSRQRLCHKLRHLRRRRTAKTAVPECALATKSCGPRPAMCSVGIVRAYCPGHCEQREVRRENEKLCDEARPKLNMGACTYGIVEYYRFMTTAHCRECLFRIEKGIKDKKRKDAKKAK